MAIIMRTKERELLERAISLIDYRYAPSEAILVHREIKELLAQPEQNNIQYLLDQVARLTAENAMLKEKWLAPKRKHLTGIEISQGFQTDDDATHPYSYWSGVNFAEKAHGITGGGEE